MYCLMFSDTSTKILAQLDKEGLHEDQFKLDGFIFKCMCIPAYTIGCLFTMLVPTETKLELSKAVNKKYDKVGPNGKKDKLYVLSQRKRKTLVEFKNKLLSLIIGAKFLEEYFVCHSQYNMHLQTASWAYQQLKFDKTSCTPDDKAVIAGKFLINTNNGEGGVGPVLSQKI